ncbi:hypothetical protein L3X38_010612 [Prunus dulcis]|uniref:Uncharacterized protein n=1 Tax=Prunus dulcis TaxID=3755 RepID=A0AAD4WIB5_PRUDU|nr:hypothetical protein L3X38_010612 [Prunus dulcis]
MSEIDVFRQPSCMVYVLSRVTLVTYSLVLRQVVSKRVSPISILLALIMGDRERDVAGPIMLADLDAQKVRIENLANEFGEIHNYCYKLLVATIEEITEAIIREATIKEATIKEAMVEEII